MAAIDYTKSIVFLVGAGASAPYGLPVMTQFMNRAKRRSQHVPEEDPMHVSYACMFDFWVKCRESSWAFIRNWDNIEELYTQADLRRMMKTPKGYRNNYQSEICKHISWCIWDVYRSFPGMPNWDGLLQTVFTSAMRPVVITTNYDLTIETSITNGLQRTAKFFYPSFGCHRSDRWVMEGDKTKPSDYGPIVPIAKLHGSVNWFESTSLGGIDDPLIKCDFEVAVDNKHQKESGMRHTRNFLLVESQNEGSPHGQILAPAIIPPMLGKSALSEVIRENWRFAQDALKDARQVVVIGYSFPPTDTFMLRLLTEGLSQNRDFERLLICDIQPPEAWRGRVESMFEPLFRQQYLRYWQEDSRNVIGLLANGDVNKWSGLLNNKNVHAI